ncbi:MAG: thiamine phosphate synthase [Polyangiaceae bacterium]|nr:thiamine phosphate synthase [Polyangiaceae bacterium]
MRSARLPAPLLLITDRSQARRPLTHVIQSALEGGCRWVSLREKDMSPSERLSLVNELLPIVRQRGGTLLVHGDIHAAIHSDGVHLPAGANVAEARTHLGESAIIGLSCHTLEDVAASTGADYVTLGPFARTASKPGLTAVLKPEVLREAALLGVPVFALGGVDETNVGMLKRAGASGFAVMGGVMRSEDPGNYVKRLMEAWDAA